MTAGGEKARKIKGAGDSQHTIANYRPSNMSEWHNTVAFR